MISTSPPKILAKRLSLTPEEIRALDPLYRRFVIALAVIGDVEIQEEGELPDQDSRPGMRDGQHQRGGA